VAPARCGPHGMVTSPTLMLIQRRRAEGWPWRMVVAWRRTCTLRPKVTDACTVAAPGGAFHLLQDYTHFITKSRKSRVHQSKLSSTSFVLRRRGWNSTWPYIYRGPHKQACSGEHSATGSHMPVAPVDTSGTSCCLLSRVALMMVRHNNHMMH